MTKLRLIFENEKQLLKIAVGIAILWVVAQIVLIVCFWGHPQLNDMGAYISMARRCFANGEWYPMAQDIYSGYIWTPGFINYLILQLRILGTVDFNAVLNLFLNIAILFEVYYLGQKFFSKRVGFFSVIIFCLLYSNLLIVLSANTEVPFMFLCLSALCLIFSGKWKYIILAAVLFALANWIRPLVIIFLFASVVYFVITKAKFYNYITLIIPYIVVLFIIGTATEKKIGYFVYQSTTAGFNLVLSLGDSTNNFTVDLGSIKERYIENENLLTFVERDSIWKSRSFTWIKENPIKFITFSCRRIQGLYSHDTWPRWAPWVDEPKRQIFKNALLSIPYYLAFLFFFYCIWVNRREIFTVKSVFLIILVVGTFITCCMTHGNQRFHYPFMFTVILYAAYGIDTLIERKTVKKTTIPPKLG
jgi:hypothetical protein